MLRWLDECIHPKQKCARVGHAPPRNRIGTAIVRPRLVPYHQQDSCGAIAYRVSLQASLCRRCGEAIHQPQVIRVHHGIQNVSMASVDWETLEERGYVWR